MKIKLFLFYAALFAISCSSDDGGAATAKTNLKVMSFNIRYSNTIDTGDNAWDARREPCMALIRDVKPDVIGFQEPRADQHDELSAELNEYAAVSVPQGDGITWAQTGYTMVMYLKSKYTLLDSGYYWLSATPEVPSRPWNASDTQYRTAVWVHLKDNASQKEFLFFTTHMPYKTDATDNEARLNACRLNVEKMKEKAGRHMPVFITGDMNASYASNDGRRDCLEPYYEWMWSARDTAPDTDSEYSYNNFGLTAPGTTWNIDHIFYRRVTPLQFRTITSPDYGVAYVSDHYPIVLTVEF